MRRVLIPSDNQDFVAELARAYARLGWDAVVGRANFELETGQFDLVHLQWPEELSGWEAPSSAQIDGIARRLERWSQRAKLLLTVHNLHPHRQVTDPSSVQLYEAVYARVPVLLHFTETSRRQVCEHFPQAAKQRNVVTGFFNWDGLLPARHEGLPARERMGIWPGDFMVLVFGALREWPEARLISRAYSMAAIPGKRLLMAGRYQESGPVWRQRWRRWIWARWLRRSRAVVVDRFVPDEQVIKSSKPRTCSSCLACGRSTPASSGWPQHLANPGSPRIAALSRSSAPGPKVRSIGPATQPVSPALWKMQPKWIAWPSERRIAGWPMAGLGSESSPPA